MKEKIKQASLYAGHILLTACVSALIAILQNYIAHKGGVPSEQIDPTKTGVIGSVVSAGHLAFRHIKNTYL